MYYIAFLIIVQQILYVQDLDLVCDPFGMLTLVMPHLEKMPGVLTGLSNLIHTGDTGHREMNELLEVGLLSQKM